jgi:hypothetical protein
MEIAVDIDGHGLLGIELERCSPDRRAAVRLVMPGSLALRTGRVRRGMVLTSVNGQPTAALCFDDTMALLRNFAQARPLRLGLVMPAQSQQQAQAQAQAQASGGQLVPRAAAAPARVGAGGAPAGGGGGTAAMIEVRIVEEGMLGIDLQPCRPTDRRAFVKAVVPHSLAAQSGRVRPGLLLMAVNGQPTASLRFNDTLALLRNFAQARPLALSFAPPAAGGGGATTTITINGAGMLGLDMERCGSGATDRCARIKAVLPAPALAAETGRVAPGMVLTAVNGRDCTALCFDDTMALLRNYASARPLCLRFADSMPELPAGGGAAAGAGAAGGGVHRPGASSSSSSSSSSSPSETGGGTVAVDVVGQGMLGLDMDRCTPDRRALVKLVVPQSLAAATGRVGAGMVLTAVNGHSTAALGFDATMATLRACAQQRPLRLWFAPADVRVQFVSEGTLGLELEPCCATAGSHEDDRCARVKRVLPQSLSCGDPRIVPGLVLASINGQSTAKLHFDATMELLRGFAAVRPLKLVFAALQPPPPRAVQTRAQGYTGYETHAAEGGGGMDAPLLSGGTGGGGGGGGHRMTRSGNRILSFFGGGGGEPEPIVYVSPEEVWRARQAQQAHYDTSTTQHGVHHAPTAAYYAEDPQPVPSGGGGGGGGRAEPAPANGAIWQKPSIQAAEAYASQHHPRDPRTLQRLPLCATTTGRHCTTRGCGACFGRACDPCGEGVASEFVCYGAGVSSYFKFIKWMGIVYFILFVVHLPVIVINSFGTVVSDDEGIGLAALALTTLGNLGSNATAITLPGCNAELLSESSLEYPCTLDRASTGALYAWLDAAGCLVALVAFEWLKVYEVREGDKVDRNTVTASDFAVHVKWVPPQTTERELKKHFERVVGCAVAKVSIAEDNGKIIELFQQRGQLVKAKARLDGTERYLQHCDTTLMGAERTAAARRLKKVQRQQKALREKLERMDRRRAALPRGERALCAYVCFDEEAAKIRCLALYPDNFWMWLLMPRRRRLGAGGHAKRRITVVEAPDPSTIMWENQQYGHSVRMKRRLTSTALLSIFLALSIGLVFLSKEYQQDAENKGGTKTCPRGFKELPELARRAAVERAQSTGTDADKLQHCYCSPLSGANQLAEPLCRDFYIAAAVADGLTSGSTLGIAAVNIAMIYFTRRIAETYERHRSLTTMYASIFNRVFLLQFVNVGIVVLVINSDWFLNRVLSSGLKGTADFDTFWYETVGSMIMLTCIMTIFSPHGGRCWSYWRRGKRVAAKAETLHTQRELNALLLGPPFRMAVRYAEMMSSIFVIFMYSAGMPILYLVGACQMLVNYWLDKFFFLRYYRKPPRFDEKIGRRASGLFPYAIMLHLCTALWMYGNPVIFLSDSLFDTDDDGTTGKSSPFDYTDRIADFIQNRDPTSVSDHVGKQHLVPILGLFVLMVVSKVLVTVGSSVTSVCMRLANFFSCGHVPNFDRALRRLNKQQVRYTDALRHDRANRHNKVIMGLPTYDVMENPEYREAFGVRDESFEQVVKDGATYEVADIADRQQEACA